MSPNFETYRQKAIESCKQVFVTEYNRSVGIPLPSIDFILPDSVNYNSGEYYIRIDETWQIHLNFGLMPVSYKEFQEEVRVLTRHEIEHYMCCPFNVLTHFQMLSAIIDTYTKYYSNHQIDILSLAASLANQTADIIIDTKNFSLHKEETLKSEIAWIKKSGSTVFKELPRHSKLMFLTKEAIWRVNLELDEDDKQLLAEVTLLAQKLENGGITNKSLFIQKTIEYTHSFFKLFKEDKNEQESKQSEHSKKDSQNGQSGQPKMIPSKDSHENGSQFVFESPDKIQEALEQFALETSVEQFGQVLSAAGLESLTEKEKNRIWFQAQNVDMIPIIEQNEIGSDDKYSYPSSWKLGDPIEEIDMMLSFAMSPVIIPGVTTKKWVQNPIFSSGAKNKDLDLLLVIDTSGSMGTLIDSKSNIHQVVLASYGILKYFESKSNKVSLIGFADRISIYVDWTEEYNIVRESLLINGSGATKFPLLQIQEAIDKKSNPAVTVLFTDGDIKNFQQTLDYFKEYVMDGNRLFIFLLDRKNNIESFKMLTNFGAKVAKTLTAVEMRNAVISDLF